MVLWGRLTSEREIRAGADKFHDVFSNRPHHISNICPDKVQGCDLHGGDWGREGSVIYWNYVLDGKPSVAKEIVQDIDKEKNSLTFKVIEGTLLDDYKSFKIGKQVTPKGGGSVVKWTVEYEKLNESTQEPLSFLELLIHCTNAVDAHLVTPS